MLDKAAQTLQRQADSLAEMSPERAILDQFALLIKLEHAIAQRRYAETNK
jgi:hypothetical protein